MERESDGCAASVERKDGCMMMMIPLGDYSASGNDPSLWPGHESDGKGDRFARNAGMNCSASANIAKVHGRV